MSKKIKVRVKPVKGEKLHEFVIGKKYMFSFRKYYKDMLGVRGDSFDLNKGHWGKQLTGVVFNATEHISVDIRGLWVCPEWCVTIK